MSNIQIGKRIQKLRELQNYSREGFAEEVGISAKFLYEIENGKKGLSANSLAKIAKKLSVSCDYIMYGEMSEEEEERQRTKTITDMLRTLEPKQVSQIQEIVKVLCTMFEAL